MPRVGLPLPTTPRSRYDRSDNINIGYAISGTGSVAQDGSDTLTLSGSNGYSGGTEIDTGNLAFGSAASIGGGTGNANVTINQAGALNVSGPYTTVMGWLAAARSTRVPQAGTALTGNSGETPIDMKGYDSLALGAVVD